MYTELIWSGWHKLGIFIVLSTSLLTWVINIRNGWELRRSDERARYRQRRRRRLLGQDPSQQVQSTLLDIDDARGGLMRQLQSEGQSGGEKQKYMRLV